ncbi:hypothetical protein D9M71_785340 [compost metagenome]
MVPGIQPADVRGRNGGNLGGLLDVLEHLQQPEPEQWMLLDQQRIHCLHSPLLGSGLRGALRMEGHCRTTVTRGDWLLV